MAFDSFLFGVEAPRFGETREEIKYHDNWQLAQLLLE